ncbi:MAG: SPFH domain-containing protein [Nocardioides sp.]|nr:SPFH domain-containing protein [Nocardioides sp.]
MSQEETQANPSGDDVSGTYRAPDESVLVERPASTSSGVPWLVGVVILVVAAVALGVTGAATAAVWAWILFAVAAVAVLTILAGFYTLTPNEAAVLTLFGDYRGTDRESGLRIANPLYGQRKISRRIRNFNTSSSKVNDANGNPIHIAAVVVWRVVDTARAAFGVDDFVDYVEIQSESAVRQMARAYPYESFDEPGATTLIGEPDMVNDHLLRELQERADAAGVEVVEARVTDLSYAAEVAEAMLRRQQASAIVAGRYKIVEGAVGMVQDALASLEDGADGATPVSLDADRRAAFAANLMTVIVSDSPTTPVVNVGGRD